jgi:hypothetical protein
MSVAICGLAVPAYRFAHAGYACWVHATYVATAPLWALLNRVARAYATTTEKVGRAMIKVAREGYKKPVLESEDINRVST